MDDLELLAAQAYDAGAVSEVIRPSAVLPEDAARAVLVELSLRDVRSGGHWHAEPSLWQRWDQPWTGGGPAGALLLGSLQVAYGTPTRYEITVYRATVTLEGQAAGLTVASLCDEALTYGGLTLATCPRAALAAPPRPFRFH